MSDDSIIKNSSMLLAYLGGLGWGSAYFYGWGVSAYYGFPWWYVGVGPDNIARSLFHAISLMAIFIIAWGVGILLFFLVKQKDVFTTLASYAFFWQRFCSLFQLLSSFLS